MTKIGNDLREQGGGKKPHAHDAVFFWKLSKNNVVLCNYLNEVTELMKDHLYWVSN